MPERLLIAYSPTENSPFVASILIFPNREMSLPKMPSEFMRLEKDGP